MRKEEKADSKSGTDRGVNHEVELTLSEDPLLRFFSKPKNCQYLLLAILAVACSWYIYSAIREQALVSRRLAADAFSNVREEYSKLSELQQSLQKASQEGAEAETASLEVDLGESRARFEEILKSMADSGNEYKRIADLYRAVADREMGDASAAKVHLLKFDQDKIQAGDSQNFYTEMAVLMLARQLLEQPDSLAEARKLLSELISSGRYVNASAAYSLALISSSEQEKKEAFSVISEYISRHPEQAELLEAELKSVVVEVS